MMTTLITYDKFWQIMFKNKDLFRSSYVINFILYKLLCIGIEILEEGGHQNFELMTKISSEF